MISTRSALILVFAVGTGAALSGCATGTSASYSQRVPIAADKPILWDWGGGNVAGSSGQRPVRFPKHFAIGEIVVSFSDRQLYYISRPGEAISYPIAIPRDVDRWQGITNVSDKKMNPSWTPTRSMIAENPRLPLWVPGGHPMNPLGVRALYLGDSTYRIHGTDAPWTIGTAISKGCIRMYNEDVLDLYSRAFVGAKVTVTWERYTSAT